MQINVIHIAERKDRSQLLQAEFISQGINDYKIWNGVVDPIIPYRGISKSHKQIVKYAKEMGLSEILIAEDDLHFTAKGAFNHFLKNKPFDFDIYLASIYFGTLANDNTVKEFSGLTFYIVNERFYDKFLSVPGNQHLDRELKNEGRFYVCNPFAVIQHNGFSDNKKQYCNYDSYLKNRELFC